MSYNPLSEFEDHDLAKELRRRGCAVVVFSTEEVGDADVDQLETLLAEKGNEYLGSMRLDAGEEEEEGRECEKCSALLTPRGEFWEDQMGRLDCAMGGQHYPSDDEVNEGE